MRKRAIPSRQTVSCPLMPALATTTSTVLLGDLEAAVAKRLTWSDQVRTLHLANAALSLGLSRQSNWIVEVVDF